MDKSTVALEADRIIDSLGGTGEVARIFDVDPAAVSQWRRNGIPRARLHTLRLTQPEVFSDVAQHAEQTAKREAV
ncbi:Cro/CI family transcriptional regulator [Paraburkholderia sp. CNPSo 3272]|uniref:Cro/CI family transcriptional regulator n=1 Tax=Paraburkholderia sp. CNPSo 3272 TaxID=2940931 RepID=UPI0020B77D5F|nr:Cro/CI family transcriptional regulator [Paraburkholderia sp. CNPSo 3272]MCP3721757.1 Cro/CI family transcriptional regulator [Paraburkholderia sp. CNPSo 3272]